MSEMLMVAFFERDLTETEEEGLARLLESSVEGAERFAELGAEYYRLLGLPEPDLPSGASSSPPGRIGGIGGFTIGAAGLVVAGSLLWRSLTPPPVVVDGTKPAVQQATRKSVDSSPVLSVPRKTDSPKVLPGGEETASRETAVNPLKRAETVSDETQRGGRLVIKVDLKSEGELAVFIHSSDGRLIRKLAEGNYPAGIHRFPWDGKDEGGVPVLAGRYKVVVNSAGERMEQWLDIRQTDK